MNVELNRRINSVGKGAFVKYFPLFVDKSLSTQEIASRMHQAEGWTFNSCMGRTSTSRRIITDGDHVEVLNYIANSGRMDEKTTQKAIELLSMNSAVLGSQIITPSKLALICKEVAHSLDNEMITAKVAVGLAEKLRYSADLVLTTEHPPAAIVKKLYDIRGESKRKFGLDGRTLSCGSYNANLGHSWVDIPTHRIKSTENWDIVVGRQGGTLSWLRVPSSYLLNNLPSLYVRGDNGYISLHIDDSYTDKKGSGGLQFISFLNS